MIRYQGIWVGPIDPFYYGERWVYGRILVYEGDKFLGFAIDVPLMRPDDFAAFFAWLENFESEKPLTFSEIVHEFENTYFELDFFDEW